MSLAGVDAPSSDPTGSTSSACFTPDEILEGACQEGPCSSASPPPPPPLGHEEPEAPWPERPSPAPNAARNSLDSQERQLYLVVTPSQPPPMPARPPSPPRRGALSTVSRSGSDLSSMRGGVPRSLSGLSMASWFGAGRRSPGRWHGVAAQLKVSARSWRRGLSWETEQLSQNVQCFDDVVQARRRASMERSSAEARMVFMPGNRFLFFWRIWMVCVTLWTTVMSPVELAFSWWNPPVWYKVVFVLIDVSCWADMVLSFFIASIVHGKVVVDFRRRSMIYVKSWFAVDILTNFPWDLIFAGAGKSRKLGKLMKLPKIFRMARLLRAAREEAYYFGVLFAVFAMVLLAHYSCCCWVALLVECEDSMHLLTADDSLAQCPPIGDAYAQAFSVGMATLSGTDAWLRFALPAEQGAAAAEAFVWGSSPWGDVSAAAWCLVGFCTLAVLFDRIAQSLQSQDSHTRAFHDRLANLQAAEHQYGIDPVLYHRARRHYHYVWSCGSNSALAVLQDEALSADLRRQLALAFYGGALQKVPFLSHADDGFLKILCERVSLECFAPEDQLVVAGELCSDLCFLVVGEVRIEAPKSRQVIKRLVAGSFFGEMALLFPESSCKVTVAADTAGWMLTVSRVDLEQICSEELLDSFRSVAFERYQEERHSVKSAGEHLHSPEKSVHRLMHARHSLVEMTADRGSGWRSPARACSLAPEQQEAPQLKEAVRSAMVGVVQPFFESTERRLMVIEKQIVELARSAAAAAKGHRAAEHGAS